MLSKFGKVVVLMGGNSPEREISLATGKAIWQALCNNGVAAEMLDVTGDYVYKLISGNYDRAFVAIHGAIGEDGVIQGVLEALSIPYTGSGVLGSAVSIDKARCKLIWQQLGVATLDFMLWDQQSGPEQYIAKFGLPLVVKPLAQGSSIGVSQVNQADEFWQACEYASKYGEVLIEPWVIGDEYSVGILSDMVLPSILIKASQELGFYSYKAKYGGGTEYICPSPLSDATEQKLQSLAKQAFTSIGASGWGRVDLIRDQSGKFWVLEVNTVPGMVEQSLVPKAAAAVGINFDQLVMKILTQTNIANASSETQNKISASNGINNEGARESKRGKESLVYD